MGPSQNFLIRVGSDWVNFLWLGLGQVSHLWFGLEFRKFPLKTSNFSIFFPSNQKKLLRVESESTRVKAGLTSYLLRVKSKLRLGRRVRAHLYFQHLLKRVGSIFVNRVSHIWFGSGLGKFPQKIPIFSIFFLRVKKISSGRVKDRSASYLQRVKSKLGSGQGPSLR